jgi:hypothetical protein
VFLQQREVFLLKRLHAMMFALSLNVLPQTTGLLPTIKGGAGLLENADF